MNAAFVLFYQRELDTFQAARNAEIEEDGKIGLINQLSALKESFYDCLIFLNDIVETKSSTKPDLSLHLLTCCGAELLNAHSKLTDVFDAYTQEIESA